MEFETVDQAIDNLRYSDKIKFIEMNYTQCQKGVIQRRQNYIEYPNCWGTTLFVTGGDKIIQSKFPSKRKNGTFILGDEMGIETSFIPAEFNRPGHICKDHINWFLSNQCSSLVSKAEGCIIGGYRLSSAEDYSLMHTMIFLGRVNGKELVFEQDGLGGEFQATELISKNNILSYRYFRFN